MIRAENTPSPSSSSSPSFQSPCSVGGGSRARGHSAGGSAGGEPSLRRLPMLPLLPRFHLLPVLLLILLLFFGPLPARGSHISVNANLACAARQCETGCDAEMDKGPNQLELACAGTCAGCTRCGSSSSSCCKSGYSLNNNEGTKLLQGV